MSDAIISSVYGGLAVAVAQGLLIGVAFWYLELPSPILWGMVAAVCSMVPIVGSGAVWVPGALILFASDSWGQGLLLFGWGVLVVGTIDNIIRPYVMSERVQLPTLPVFFALLGGVHVFGIIGLFVGPVVLAVTLALFSMLGEEIHAWQLQWREEQGRADLESMPRHANSREIGAPRDGTPHPESIPVLLPDAPDPRASQ